MRAASVTRATRGMVLLLMLNLVASETALGQKCASQKSDPIKFVLRSTRTSSGQWEAKMKLERSYKSDTGTRPVHIQLQRNGTNCEGEEPISLVVDIVASPAITLNSSSPDGSGSEYHIIDGADVYRLHTEIKDWWQAKRTCDEEGSHLAVIKSEAEAKKLTNIFSQNLKIQEVASLNDQAYLGASDIATDGVFITVKGVPLNSTGNYNVWREETPDRNHASGNCITVGRDGKLFSVPCDYKLAFFCQKERVEKHPISPMGEHH